MPKTENRRPKEIRKNTEHQKRHFNGLATLAKNNLLEGLQICIFPAVQ